MKDSFNYKRKIETAGWSIHPFGSYYGYLLGSVDEALLEVFTTSKNCANVLKEMATHLARIFSKFQGQEFQVLAMIALPLQHLVT